MLYEACEPISRFSSSKEDAAAAVRGAPKESAQAMEANPRRREAQELWDSYTQSKRRCSKTHTTFSMDHVKANDKQRLDWKACGTC